jgi:hypothetical protein
MVLSKEQIERGTKMLQEYFNTHKDEKIVEFASHTLNHLFEQKTGVPIDTPVTPEYKLKIISEIINKGYKPDSNDKFFIDSLKKDIKKIKQFEPIVIVERRQKKDKDFKNLHDKTMELTSKATDIYAKAMKEHHEYIKKVTCKTKTNKDHNADIY